MRITHEFLNKLSMSQDDYDRICKELLREPNETELYIFSAMWSEHCGYKHSKRLLRTHFKIKEENAGIVWIGEYGIVFKVESHNHPCAVEPFQGAATGVGGIIRDIIAMGARPVASLNSLHFGRPHSHIYEGVISGISVYGNSIGVPNVGGEVRFDVKYEVNPLVNVMAVGIAKREDICSSKARGVGNTVVLVGSKTGRDGIHGASFASRKIDGKLNDRPSVQVGDPFTGKKLIEATLEISKLKSVIAVQDMGAAGILSSTTEMADRGGLGLDLKIDAVPLRESGMNPWEILLSESQERMAFIVEKGKEAEIKSIANKWELDCAEIGTITVGGLFRVFDGKKIVASIPLSLVVKAPDLSKKIEKTYPYSKEISRWSGPIAKTLTDLLSNPIIASKKSVYERYDYTVGGLTVKGPGADAAVLYLGENIGMALSLNGNVRYTAIDPKTGTKAVLFETCSNIVASGGRPLGITNCMNFGNPENEEIAAQFYGAVLGLEEGAKLLGIPVTGGNVSFYNENGNSQIPPTPVIGVVGEVRDVLKIPSSSFKTEGNPIYLIGKRYIPKNGASLYSEDASYLPDVDWDMCVKTLDRVLTLMNDGLIVSAHDVSDGGIAVSCAEMTFQSMKGVKIFTLLHPFEEYPARFIVEIDAARVEEFEKKLEGIEFESIGIIEGNSFVWNDEIMKIAVLKVAHESLVEDK